MPPIKHPGETVWPGEKPRLLKILSELDLPEGQWLLSGSGAMVMHGIERGRPMGDVDIFVATRVWFELYHRDFFNGTMQGVRLEDGRKRWQIWTTHSEDVAARCDPPYLVKEMHGIEVNIFHSWRQRDVGNIDVAFWMLNADVVDGIPCVPMQFLLDWKEQFGRAKDRDDIATLSAWLARRESA